ncbi:MAG: hypothetical protein WKF84_03800 [Pyrinomonadaceae bacterium]
MRFRETLFRRRGFSPFAQAVLANTGVLQPNNGGVPGTNNYVRDNYINTQGTLLDPWTKFSAKLDHSFSERNRDQLSSITIRFTSKSPDQTAFPGLPGVFHNFPRFLDQKSKVYRANWTSVIRPTVVNYFLRRRRTNSATTINTPMPTAAGAVAASA